MDVESLRESHSVLALFLSSLHILGLFFLIMLPADVCVDSQTRSCFCFSGNESRGSSISLLR